MKAIADRHGASVTLDKAALGGLSVRIRFGVYAGPRRRRGGRAVEWMSRARALSAGMAYANPNASAASRIGIAITTSVRDKGRYQRIGAKWSRQTWLVGRKTVSHDSGHD